MTSALEFKAHPRVVSLVPSWTETLVAAGVNVVGRTRFCIHPLEKVKDIAIVGGTKNLDLTKLAELAPDLVIFDREENTREMYDACQFQKWSSHVLNLESLSAELRKVADLLANTYLRELSEAVARISAMPARVDDDLMNLPGVIRWVKAPSSDFKLERVHYLIWKNPWMEVSADTYIGSVLAQLGLGSYLRRQTSRYPEVSWEKMAAPGGLLLLSSEPFPFEKFAHEFESLNSPVAIVDGECFSWFGARTVKFLSSI